MNVLRELYERLTVRGTTQRLHRTTPAEIRALAAIVRDRSCASHKHYEPRCAACVEASS